VPTDFASWRGEGETTAEFVLLVGGGEREMVAGKTWRAGVGRIKKKKKGRVKKSLLPQRLSLNLCLGKVLSGFSKGKKGGYVYSGTHSLKVPPRITSVVLPGRKGKKKLNDIKKTRGASRVLVPNGFRERRDNIWRGGG